MKRGKFDKQQIIKLLIDPKSNQRIITLTTYGILAVIAFGMTVMNIITHKGALTVATGVFSFLCIADFVMTLWDRGRMSNIATLIFCVELVVLFSFFLLSGNPEGFSAIWICMVPSAAMLFFRRKRGTVFCGVIFSELVFLLWTARGRSLLPAGVYTATFLTRFPVLYLAFFCMAYFLQLLQDLTWKRLDENNRILAEQATHDHLTGLYNRQGLFNVLEKHMEIGTYDSVGAIIFDIDHFKRVNDTYGHDAGDVVLIRCAEIFREGLRAEVGRWGGEEFAAFFRDDSVTPEDVNNVIRTIEREKFRFKNQVIRVTCSAGVSELAGADLNDIRGLIQKADNALYLSKESGRNRVSYMTAEKAEGPAEGLIKETGDGK